ncbi:MAG: hypothetical protein PHR77_20465 [Kiritimatiellae bacterium]|nr:hypothetical protein [Kiritimatiellia bacterium]MDD5521073.1 hypothetical protein [Kiritimatiellia bacterium]
MMKNVIISCNFACACLLAVSAAAGANLFPALTGSDGFARYQSIIDRKPFGEPLSESAQATNSSMVAQGDLFTKTLKMVAIKMDRNGQIRVGFVNQAAKNKSYYLRVGEISDDGIEVIGGDFEEESAVLRKESQTGVIYMNGSHMKASGMPGALASSVASAIASKFQSGRSSRSEIMKKRDELRQARMLEKPKYEGEELEKHLKEYQMEVIRKGMPALPIPLTKEMDDQLVAEGVLPPLQPGQGQSAQTPAVGQQ